MNLPSVKTLERATLDPVKAKELRELLEGKRKTRDYASVQTLEKQCYHPPDYNYRLLIACNEILGGFGIEVIAQPGEMPIFEYINLGDTYTTTLMRNILTGRIFVSDMGTIVERERF